MRWGVAGLRLAAGILIGTHGTHVRAEPTSRQPNAKQEQRTPQAADAASPPVYRTVVVGSRTETDSVDLPMAISVVEPQEALGPGLSLADALPLVPGLWVQNRFNQAQDLRLSIRGFGARSAFGVRGIQLFLDGIPLTLPDGQSQVDALQLSDIKRIEVLRGPAGALYGNASGGVIWMTTDDGPRRPAARVRSTVGAFGLLRVILEGATGTNNVQARVGVRHEQWSGFREQSASSERAANGAVTFTPSKSLKIKTNFLYYYAPENEDPGGLTLQGLRTAPRSASDINLRFKTGEAIEQALGGVSVQWRPHGSVRVDLALFGHQRDYRGAVPFRVVDLGRQSFGGRSQVTWHHELLGRKARLVSGVEAQWQRDDRKNWQNQSGQPTGPLSLSQKQSVRSQAAFAQEHWQVWQRLWVLAGLRVDGLRFSVDDVLSAQEAHRDFLATSAHLGALIPLSTVSEIYANWAQAFEAPTTTELMGRPGGLPGLNRNVSPQRAWSAEVGARTRGEAWRVEAAAYYIRLHDELVPFEDMTAQTFYRNAGASHRYGAEAAALFRTAKWLEVEASYNLLKASFLSYQLGEQSFDGNFVPGLPVHSAALRARWQAPGGLFVRTQAQFASAFYVNDANSEKAPWRLGSLAEVGWAARVADVSTQLVLGVDNVLNRLYADNVRPNATGGRYYEPIAPRFFYVSAQVAWGWDPPASRRF